MHTHAQRKKSDQTEQSTVVQPALAETSFNPPTAAAGPEAQQSEGLALEGASPEQAVRPGHSFANISIFSDAQLASGSPPFEGGTGMVQRSVTSGVIQRRADDTAREQNNKRGEDTASTAPPSVYASFGSSMPAGQVQGPSMRHDHGFLDDGHGNIDESKREEAGWGDHIERMKWIAKLEAAELLRPDLVDGTSAYRHFLFGNGAQRHFEYERFIANDSSGATVLASAIEDAKNAVRDRHNQILQSSGDAPPASSTIDLQTPPMGVGNDGRYPYPATENWQKAIGAHQIWIEAHFTVSVDQENQTRSFQGTMTIHVEDMYNFNPGAADIASGTPDAANGRFEVTGLGHEYLNTSEVTRSIAFEEALTSTTPAHEDGAGVGGEPRVTPGQPGDSRGRAAGR
ncbi:MAG TPA: hypothetical protein VFS21_21615 [Roseiflexaceae bacterium]|nr:hypothetical protein [Roseiflexaceae bacterium]